MTMLDHALAYASAGIPVLPLQPQRKEPATRHGKDDATTDADIIIKWWTRKPDCNIGLRPRPGMLVVDIDPRNNGDMTLRDRLPNTWTAKTGSGGLHLWLRATGERWRAQLADGIDLKTAAGYLVAPPSVHPGGGTYRWLNNAPIAQAPGWLIAQATRPKPPPPRPFDGTAGRREAALIAAVAEAGEGTRNGILFWAACRAVESGAYQLIRDSIADAARSTGLSEREIDATLRSAERRAAV